MKEAYLYYAKCNTKITTDMLNILKANRDAFSYKSNGYYDSIGSILDHMYISNLNWINDFCKVIETRAKNEINQIEIPEYGKMVFGSIEEASTGIIRTVELTEELCDDLCDEDFEKIMIKKRRNGQIVEKKVWKALFHYFNHQTHHRGQISQVLDELKIENDYSNMIYIE
jgi:uncharacterized damage-inducible protein DinB